MEVNVYQYLSLTNYDIDFFQDGIKVSVGDCAFFKPHKDTPPFVGMIHRLIISKEDNLSLSVCLLYQSADVILVKGLLEEAAPNEVFYSFHKIEIPAASLIQPCKVAFLRKGVELPSGLSPLVCRRVYDTGARCLRWLTDTYVKVYNSLGCLCFTYIVVVDVTVTLIFFDAGTTERSRSTLRQDK